MPVPDDESAPYWAATADGRLVLPRCSRCGRVSHPPGPVCPRCHTTNPEFTFDAAATRGVVRSWTVIRQSFLPGFDGDLPFVLVDVALEVVDDDAEAGDEVRLIGRLLDGPDAPMRIGDAVEVRFEQLADGVAVPAFTLVP